MGDLPASCLRLGPRKAESCASLVTDFTQGWGCCFVLVLSLSCPCLVPWYRSKKEEKKTCPSNIWKWTLSTCVRAEPGSAPMRERASFHLDWFIRDCRVSSFGSRLRP
ncbi:hypothetical protein K432DRAFT_109995 [Lepidopterella palustris CBS 459.81]|uniref:Uncharacterized protein n=1 Tax=Lepidopterella palustris CBS 459.81 TaxID=1314670 RepID=A0A8E2E5S0_9PEZI|nr:hypothetical protein K432DRAFT_109995 [Lepidopterella palustris CBS 459.81]